MQSKTVESKMIKAKLINIVKMAAQKSQTFICLLSFSLTTYQQTFEA